MVRHLGGGGVSPQWGRGGIPRHVTCPLIKCKRNHVAALQSNTLLEIVDDKS